jgi:hypothetical protein
MDFEKKIFSISNEEEFNSISLTQFDYQKKYNSVYSAYLEHIGYNKNPTHYSQIPFLPIQFFKTHKVICENFFEKVFESSGTTQSTQTSKHFVHDLILYHQSAQLNFDQNFGTIKDYVVLALLPSYLERTQSSLVEMVNYFMQLSNKNENGFFLYNHLDLFQLLNQLEKKKKKTVLFGVAFALLDFFAQFPMQLQNTMIIETGGMKGRKKEITKMELHNELKKQSGLNQIYSEYGMTELLSQCYTKFNDNFISPNWMKIIIRDPNDPFSILPNQHSGGINIIDLANVYSCPFIATDDLGKKTSENTFEVLGRFDQSDIRGCSLMIEF